MATTAGVIPSASTITYRMRPAARCASSGPLSSSSSFPSRHHRLPRPFRLRPANPSWKRSPKSRDLRLVCYAAKEPLKVMISGAPASGKGTQCEMIVKKSSMGWCTSQLEIFCDQKLLQRQRLERRQKNSWIMGCLSQMK